MKQFYESPSVKKKLAIRLETSFLAGSVVSKDTAIETAGQQVEERSFALPDYNHTWE